MTRLLIRLFIRHPDERRNAAVRTAYGNLASLVGMACNLLLCLGKLTAGTLFGSIAIMADALNNLSDASSNVVSLVGFRLAPKARTKSTPTATPGMSTSRASWSASPSSPSVFPC
jgi:Predicted Co/Zn/Cd cation transporters